ncbi:pyrroline-5-carboxylate reductase [Paenibacillus motobuensis]|uniref:pyrroline-5-carboxylate reductase n=1 Tax=Paenibacillus TaxID=44249 RepID=UPI00203F9C55|nr:MULTISPECIES: pyrroline-5-carboxylate reductase [Paenibacillus]MCM3040082.1 pyrroline-5-carboxylate reductase [Paenibacillus lutimineralis]MCM3647186.1 pyrroline-5-carboxylate reductase [Paenibacillus motobuensis]
MVTNEDKSTPNPGTISFYGAGSMAEAIARGLIHKQVAKPASISMLNRSNQERLAFLTNQYGVVTSNQEEQKNKLLSEASIIVLAMKPKDAKEAITAIAPHLSEKQLLVSVIAGLSIETIQKLLGFAAPIARTMPNTSSSIGYGATGISFSDEVSEEHKQQVLTMFEAVGTVSVIPEEKMEILTGVSGSGPAYVYFMMEAMIAAGIEGGLSPEQARELTIQTVLGAAVMMRETGEDPAKLRADITSPNGSTQAALDVLREGGFTETVKAAVHRAEERSREMGQAVKQTLQ